MLYRSSISSVRSYTVNEMCLDLMASGEFGQEEDGKGIVSIKGNIHKVFQPYMKLID